MARTKLHKPQCCLQSAAMKEMFSLIWKKNKEQGLFWIFLQKITQYLGFYYPYHSANIRHQSQALILHKWLWMWHAVMPQILRNTSQYANSQGISKKLTQILSESRFLHHSILCPFTVASDCAAGPLTWPTMTDVAFGLSGCIASSFQSQCSC